MSDNDDLSRKHIRFKIYVNSSERSKKSGLPKFLDALLNVLELFRAILAKEFEVSFLTS